MVYTMLTGVFLTLFLVIGSFAFYGFLLRMLHLELLPAQLAYR